MWYYFILSPNLIELHIGKHFCKIMSKQSDCVMYGNNFLVVKKIKALTLCPPPPAPKNLNRRPLIQILLPLRNWNYYIFKVLDYKAVFNNSK